MDYFASHPTAFVIGGGFLVGFLVGLTGVGAGALMTPFLISGIGIPPVLAVGTDLLFASITKASAAWRHHSLGNVNWPIVRWLATAACRARRSCWRGSIFAEPDIHVLAGSSARCSRSRWWSARWRRRLSRS